MSGRHCLVENDTASVTMRPVMWCPLCGNAEGRFFLKAPDRFFGRTTMYTLLRCRNCECVWVDSPPGAEELPSHYGQAYHRAISAAGELKSDRRWTARRRVIEKHKPSRGAILDIGCSTGGFLATMGGWTRSGIELDEATAAAARRNTGGNIFAGDVLDATFEPCSFDVVTCFDVIEHLYQPRAALARAVEWLKPDGILYVTVPNIASWEASVFRGYWYGLELPRHLVHFSPTSLRCLVGPLGVAEVMLRTRATYIEPSAVYVLDGVLRSLARKPSTPADAPAPGTLLRAARKAVRLAALLPFEKIAAAAGAAASIESVFRK